MTMQYYVTGGGPMEASVVELSVPVLKLIIIITFTLDYMQQNIKKSTLFGCRTVVAMSGQN